MADLDQEIIRRRRGLLLLTLLEQYPLALMEAVAWRQVKQLYAEDEDAFRRDVHYLCDKQLIELRTEKLGGRNLRSLNLRPAGVDVAEGSVPEPGITIEHG